VDNEILGSRFIRILETLVVSHAHFRSTQVFVGETFEKVQFKLSSCSGCTKFHRAGSSDRVLHRNWNTYSDMCRHFPSRMCDAKRSSSFNIRSEQIQTLQISVIVDNSLYIAFH
jgi:hypothetical protein